MHHHTAIAETELRLRQACAAVEAAVRRGEANPTESWFADHPSLCESEDNAVEVIFAEYLAREGEGQKPDPEAFYARFPGFRARLERLFQVDHLLQSGVRDDGVGRSGDTEPAYRGEPRDRSAVGPYRILGRVGGGGMGVVYKAVHPMLQRVVAVKRLRGSAELDPLARVRFQREAEIIAKIRHPNIATIHEVGEDDDGPYLVLEYAEHGNLSAHLAGRPQAPKLAAQIVVQLARAADAAHRQGVVHRDLKPANVLLFPPANELPTAAAPTLAQMTPKLCDFGLASEANRSLALTRTGQTLGTPSYMAPEQASPTGKEIAATADVYALGAILYELLTGRPPFLAGDELATLNQVLQMEPVPPRRLQPNVPRDLDNICLKCLEKDPKARYRTAEDLAEDLERWRRGAPVNARPLGSFVRAGRWMRRYPVISALSAAVLTSTIVGAGLVLNHAERLRLALEKISDEAHRAAIAGRQAELALDEARASRARVRSALELTTSNLVEDWLNRQEKPTPSQRRFLESAAATFREFSREQADDPEAQRAVASAHFRLGEIQMALGQPGAVESYRQADELFESLAKRDGAWKQRQPQMQLLRRLAQAYWDAGKRREAEAAVVRACAIVLPYEKESPNDYSVALEAASVRSALGRYRSDLGDHAAALVEFDAAERTFRRLLERSPTDTMLIAGLCFVHTQAGQAAGLSGKNDDSARHHREAKAWSEKALAVRPDVPEYRANLGRAHINMGTILSARGRHDDADAEFRRGVALIEKLTEEYPAVVPYRLDLARGFGQIGLLFFFRGNAELGIPAFEASAQQARRVLTENPNSAQAALVLGATLCNHGNALSNSDGPAAIAKYEDAAKVLAPLADANPPWVQARKFYGFALRGHGRRLFEGNRDEEAVKLIAKAIAYIPEIDRGFARVDLAKAYLRLGRVEAGVAEFDAALQSKPRLTASQWLTSAALLATAADKHPRAGELAVETLRRCRSQGVVEPQTLHRTLIAAQEFRALAAREDFKRLLAELAKTPVAVPKKASP